jgi:predicted dienelactone hydrolase
MVRLFYPTASRRRPDATYLSPALSSVLVELINGLVGGDLPLDILTFRTHSRLDAPIASACRRAVLFSPGLGINAAIYTALMEELASRGYLVAGLDHTFDAVVEFPGGRVVPPAENVPFEHMLEVRTTDLRFVLDRLGSTLELSGGVAAVGHSMGSMTAVQAILADRRISAGVALDGNPLGQGSIDRPFMMLGNPSHRRERDPDWAGFYDRLRGPRLHLVVEGMEHLDLSDLTAFKSVVDFGGVFELGSIDGLRAIAITRAYVAAWLEQSFSRRSDPILRREPRRFPEVDFQP